MHSREVWGAVGAASAFLLLSALLCGALFGTEPALFYLAGGGALTVAFVLFTLRRYQRIGALSAYLAAVYAGRQTVEIRDQKPGELSALKDDLYKVTTILEEQRLREARDKTARTVFFDNVAHQLKTPLAAILLQTDVWQTPAVPSGQKDECAQNIAFQVERMQWLVETMLQLGRLDNGAVSLTARDIPAAELIHPAVRTMIPLLTQKGIDLQIDCPAALHCVCDPRWTGEAVANLLKNAAEHTPAGGTVTLRCRENPLCFACAVENTGSCLSAGTMPHLFERFWVGEGAAASSTGIGLCLAQAVAKAQNGSLRAENTPTGVRFTLQLYKGGASVSG